MPSLKFNDNGPAPDSSGFTLSPPATGLLASQFLDKYARKITAAHHRADGHILHLCRIGVVRHEAHIPMGEAERTTGPREGSS